MTQLSMAVSGPYGCHLESHDGSARPGSILALRAGCCPAAHLIE